MASHFPLRELFDSVVEWFADHSDTSEHSFGAHNLGEHRNANTFVWVPKATRSGDGEATRAVDRHRVNFGAFHVVEIHCWGATEEHAYLMAENVLYALREVGQADTRFLGGEWYEFESRSQTELGVAFVIEAAINAAFVRRYTPIAAFLAGEAAPPDPETVPTIEPIVEITARATNDLGDPGELMGSDTITP